MTSKTYHIVDEIFNSITHGIGIILAIIGLILLLIKGVALHDSLRLMTYSIYGVTLILLFLFSTLSHSLSFTRARKVFQIFDHAAIYLLIAGTYTPVCLLVVKGVLGYSILSIVWICAIIGITIKAIFMPRGDGKVPKLSTLLYLIMGWLILFAFEPLWHNLPSYGTLLILLGGILFSIGAIFFSIKFPFNHVIWHIFILIAASLMWLAVYLYI